MHHFGALAVFSQSQGRDESAGASPNRNRPAGERARSVWRIGGRDFDRGAPDDAGLGLLGYVLRGKRFRTCRLFRSSRDGIVASPKHSSKEVDMALSDQLTELAARAKEAEERAAAAQGKAKSDLQAAVETARASAQAQAQKLRESADANQNKLSVWWNDLQRSWNEHVAKVREDIDAKRAEHDVDRAEKIAEKREDDAAFAVEFAYAAIEEAEYAVLDAALARTEADEASAA